MITKSYRNLLFLLVGSLLAVAIFFGLYRNLHKDALALKGAGKLTVNQCLPDSSINASNEFQLEDSERIFFVGCGGFF